MNATCVCVCVCVCVCFLNACFVCVLCVFFVRVFAVNLVSSSDCILRIMRYLTPYLPGWLAPAGPTAPGSHEGHNPTLPETHSNTARLRYTHHCTDACRHTPHSLTSLTHLTHLGGSCCLTSPHPRPRMGPSLGFEEVVAEEILLEIFKRLDVEDLCVAARVRVCVIFCDYLCV